MVCISTVTRGTYLPACNPLSKKQRDCTKESITIDGELGGGGMWWKIISEEGSYFIGQPSTSQLHAATMLPSKIQGNVSVATFNIER